MKVSLFGNPDLPFDSLPLKILPRLRERFPDIDFVVEDPEELDLPAEDAGEWVIIDTVAGIDSVREIPIEKLIAAPRVTAHDFDLGSYLPLVKKIRKNIGIRIIGIPMDCAEEEALAETITLLSSLL